MNTEKKGWDTQGKDNHAEGTARRERRNTGKTSEEEANNGRIKGRTIEEKQEKRAEKKNKETRREEGSKELRS